jgi:hypothetical protein
MTLIIRGGKGKIIGRHDAEERDYTLPELDHSLLRLQLISNSFIDFLTHERLFAPMEKKMADSIARMTDAGGAVDK